MRVFFAIAIPNQVQQVLTVRLHTLQKEYKKAGIHWVAPEQLHVTLQFLGAVQQQDVPLLLDCVHRELQAAVSFTAELGDMHLFPMRDQPRIVAVEVKPALAFTNLALAIGRGITAAGYVCESRAFIPHLTLGRLGNHAIVLEEGSVAESFLVEEVVLFQSQLEPQLAVYTELGRISL